jgi:hypothetical protein
MKRKSFTITLMALLALLLSVGGVTGQGPEPGGEVQPEGDLSAAATVGSLISYQGRLTEGGSLVTGDRDMVFRLYSNSSCATQVGSDIVRNDVSVEDGLFSVKLAVNQSDFNGQGLWLRVLVGGTTVVSCDEIVPVPYALGLRPGAIIEDASSYVELNRSEWGTFSRKYGVFSESAGAAVLNYGVYGLASDSSGTAYGVYGRSDSTSGQGVRGYATATSGATYGVYGRSDSASGAGVYGFSSSGTGVHAYSSGGVGVHAISDSDTAVWAETSGGFAAVDGRNTTGTGVYASSDSGYGVHAISDSGVSVRAVSNSDGVYAVATGANGVALRAKGNVRILNSSDATIIELGEGLDYAEGFDVSDETEIAPGTVLVIDPDHPGELRMSDAPYDRKVAGIVAGAQGVGSAVRLAPGQFDYDVALAGRVYCSVDATETGVEPGDLLTTSATPGYAMKATDYARAQGAILGKAMERLEKGEKGQILVLVTLQ